MFTIDIDKNMKSILAKKVIFLVWPLPLYKDFQEMSYFQKTFFFYFLKTLYISSARLIYLEIEDCKVMHPGFVIPEKRKNPFFSNWVKKRARILFWNDVLLVFHIIIFWVFGNAHLLNSVCNTFLSVPKNEILEIKFKKWWKKKKNKSRKFVSEKSNRSK